MKFPTPAWWGNFLKGAARPLATYGLIGSTLRGLFDPAVTEGKLTIVAGLLAISLGLRSLDKKVEADAGKTVDPV